MTNINEENEDLIKNRIPWQLLDEETKRRMKNWRYGYEVWQGVAGSDIWSDYAQYWPPHHYDVFRAKPAQERREYFVNVYPQGVTQRDANWTGLSHEKLAIFKIAFDADGSNPTIEVVEENE